MNEQAFVMTSDQRRCIQRSRFVCRILILCVKKDLQMQGDFFTDGNEIKGIYIINNIIINSKFFYPLNSGDFVGAV